MVAEASAKSICNVNSSYGGGKDQATLDLQKRRGSSAHNDSRKVSDWLLRHELRVPVKITQVDINGNGKHPVVLPSDFCEYLANTNQLSKLTGCPIDESRNVLCDFWERFKKMRPRLPLFSMENIDWGSCIPMEIHFDGGRGFKRQEVMVASSQPVLGEGTRALQKRAKDGRVVSNGSLLKVNHCGNTFGNHLIFSVMQKICYEQDDTCLFHFAEILVKDLYKLLTEGFQWRHRRFRIATIGAKGNVALIAKLGRLTRSFAHIRKRAKAKKPEPLAGCCWLCTAGQDNLKGKVPFEDFRVNCLWILSGPGDDP